MSETTGFSEKVKNELENYVYVYSDPDTKKPFYIGKGKGDRCFNHLKEKGNSEKIEKIQELRKNGKKPIIEILVHGVDEATALKVEAAAIDLIGIENLTNVQKGHESSIYGKIDVDDLSARYTQEELPKESIMDNVLMININKSYYNGISDFELYDLTRGCWKVSLSQAKRVEFVFSVYDGMILEVYEPVGWYPAFETMHATRRPEKQRDKLEKRYEFVGHIADEKTRKKYVGKMVNNLFEKGAQNPIKYVWGKEQN